MGNEYRPLVPEGEYQVKFDGYRTEYHFGKSPKLIMEFSIVDYGEQFGTKVTRWHTVKEIKPGNSGHFKVGSQTCQFMIEYVQCLPHVGRPPRLDRIPMSHWKDHTFVARIKTVRSNSQQRALPAPLMYSKIEELLRIAE